MSPSGEAILAHPIADARQSVSAAQAILYALSVGYGSQPLDPAHLRHVYEQGLEPAPTLANVVAHHGPWMRTFGVDWPRVVHAEHRLTINRPVPLDTPLISRARTLCVVDRGVGKGLFVTFERVVAVAGTGERVATIVQTNACRGDGGGGSAGAAPDPLEAVPDRGPDAVLDLPIPESAALLYRLNGDLNPLHIDPDAAARVGYPRPILHGLCTFGLAGYAIGHLTEFGRPSRLSFLAARFSAPVYPGEHLRIEIWISGGDVRFRCMARERGVRVLDHGHAKII
ncbi:dehydratase [Methylobacterium sp. J-030]|uniref:MaoC family dehydratase n=1 Tax=Methylobacterium sp. J-030 TaxID=2836627 RepID=UPI001FBBB89D|nr:MaoC family dehydratase [Methylobacterium sp. J-030]MCJ2071362.1 dehydratase [Methylobacterium sp. J-030]